VGDWVLSPRESCQRLRIGGTPSRYISEVNRPDVVYVTTNPALAGYYAGRLPRAAGAVYRVVPEGKVLHLAEDPPESFVCARARVAEVCRVKAEDLREEVTRQAEAFAVSSQLNRAARRRARFGKIQNEQKIRRPMRRRPS
jgi:hypothetical protein